MKKSFIVENVEANFDKITCLTEAIIEKKILGIPEIMRIKCFDLNPLSIISRAVCGYRNKTLIVNLPGNPKAIDECLTVILPVLDHTIQLIQSDSLEH